jgi:hypothetical protein
MKHEVAGTATRMSILDARRVSSWVDDPRSSKLLQYAAWFYAIAWAVHTGDHLRRGLGSVTTQVSTLGTTAAVLQIGAIILVLTHHRAAPLVAVVVGIPDAIGIAAVHLLPQWSSLSDAFPGAHGTGVTGFSWIAAIVEIISAALFAAAGAYALRRSRYRAPGTTVGG